MAELLVAFATPVPAFAVEMHNVEGKTSPSQVGSFTSFIMVSALFNIYQVECNLNDAVFFSSDNLTTVKND